MRFLKNKIAKANGLENNNPLQETLPGLPEPMIPVQQPLRPKDIQYFPKPPSPKNPLTGDNIMKNYGRAMTNFALSTMARHYLDQILDRLGLDLPAFQKYIQDRRKSANCIKKLREMLPLESQVNPPDYPFKQAFQEICIKFLKFFCVNWLYSSKIAEKVTHLKYRFKILRRVKNPMFFTYLKDFTL